MHQDPETDDGYATTAPVDAFPVLVKDRTCLIIDDIAGWAVHPGGPKILDAVEDALNLREGSCDASRAVLNDHGNMSSPTVVFVIQRLIEQGIDGPIVALAFGPGLPFRLNHICLRSIRLADRNAY